MASRAQRYAIIPARMASTRFPGKPLALLHGRPLVQHVYERVRDARVFDEIIVATDDARIAEVVRRAGGRAEMTRSDHATGTERVAEVAHDLPAETLICNVQGDEPILPAGLLRDLVAFVENDARIEMATAAHPADDAEGLRSPHVVKVLVDCNGRSLYFSRAAVPFASGREATYLRHVGIYAFRQQALQRFVALPRGELERREGLEQLRALENGMPIDVLVTSYVTHGVDTPEDLKAVASRLGRFLESSPTTTRGPLSDSGCET